LTDAATPMALSEVCMTGARWSSPEGEALIAALHEELKYLTTDLDELLSEEPSLGDEVGELAIQIAYVDRCVADGDLEGAGRALVQVDQGLSAIIAFCRAEEQPESPEVSEAFELLAQQHDERMVKLRRWLASRPTP
jgi:hypothetical protein